ncbi:tRNA (adenosine(37)-N6)-threonylcarbamoyltransferase complex ATPase subunit type 1 TsaE [Spirochaetia bacterium]|nr:tRNA (adenosine(37)-N6)-threonylcarbamoyltransferase complex ATPase subunit type 1 TsaE [Spirochaetia bacterium]
MILWTLKGAFLYSLVSSTVEETIALGEKIAGALHRGSVIALRGGLGAGKTCLVQGIARGLGITERITSPTYTIVSEYAAENSLPFYHIDAYRLEGDDDFSNLGGEEFLYGGGITAIEWSERIEGSIPAGALTIAIEILEDGKRRITVGEKA